MALQILDTSFVKPLQPTQRFHLPLAYRDGLFVGGPYVRNVLFFSDPAGDFNLTAIKHGLSVALVPFYPLAGRLHISEDGTEKLTVDCNDAGVEFVEAVTDLAFADLEELRFPLHEELVQRPPGNHASPDCPLLSIQVTRFEGGHGTGFAIGVAIDHVVADGHSLFHFLKSWGECCRGVGVSLPPLHLRGVMEPEFWGMQKYLRPRFTFPADTDVPSGVPAEKVVICPPPAGSRRIMHFDSTVARELKQTATVESGNSTITTFQAVIACAWKRLCAAQSFPAHREVRLQVPVNLRDLMVPSMTASFFGNAVQQVSARATAGDLLRESLGLTAARINESARVVRDQRFLRERLRLLEEELMAHFVSRPRELEEPVMEFLVVQGSKLPVFDMDVGMGSTMQAIRPAPLYGDSDMFVFRGREEGSIDVTVCLPTQQSLEAFFSIPCPCIDI